MTFNELVREVQNIIRRASLQDYAISRVHSAITAVHSEVDQERDLIEAQEVLVTPTAVGTVALPRDMRQLELVYPLDAAGNVGTPLNLVGVRELNKLRLLKKETGTAYTVGGQVSFNAGCEISGVLFLGYVQRVEPSIRYDSSGLEVPITNPAIRDYTTWLMQAYPAAFIDYASGYLELAQGNTEQGQFLLDMYQSVHAPYLQKLQQVKRA